MSLLPSGATLVEQNFAKLLDIRGKEGYECLDLEPLTCNKSLLPHIAFSLYENIDGITEDEARAYLHMAKTNSFKKGTVKAVEEAMQVYFQEGKITEWFEDDELKKGEFRVDITVKADTSKIYDEKIFTLAKRVIDKNKNVRSHLNSFEIKLPESYCLFDVYGGGVITTNLACDVEPFLAETKFNIGGAVVWTF
jgi:phage tail P2-like protein